MSGIGILANLILILAIGYAFVYPGWGEVSALSEEKQGYEQTLATIGTIENRKQELLTQFDQIPLEDKERINTILPDSFDFVRLISEIDSVAALYGIEIDTVSGKELDPSVGDSVAEAAPSKPYQSGRISFSFESTYDDFNSFLWHLENSLRILDIRTFKLDTGESNAYQYTVEFDTYWLKTK